MTHEYAINKLMSVRHYCFLRGVLGRVPKGQPLDSNVTADKLAIFLTGCEPDPNAAVNVCRRDWDFDEAFAQVTTLYNALVRQAPQRVAAAA